MTDSDAPAWLDVALVQEALRRGGDEDTVVKSMTLRPVGAAGDNYGSTMFRITAETTAGTKSLIVKTMPPGELQKLMEDADFFSIESLLLSDLVPQMHRILEDAAPGRFPPFAAKCLYHGTEPQEFLFLEDLAPQGYQLADRHRGLGLRHSLLALRTLARFHAASVALLARDPTLRNKLPNPYRTAAGEPFKHLVSSAWEMTAETCRQWPSLPSKYTDAVDNCKKEAFDRYAQINDYHPGRFNVIAHGDFWINNMMFAYEDGVVRDYRMLDFQITHVTTPVVDLLNFLHSSVSEDVSQNYVDVLIREYYVTLSETMDLLGLQVPSLNEFLEEIQLNGFFSTFSAFVALPIIKTEKVPDLDKSMKGKGDENKFLYASPTVERWFLRLLPEFFLKGWLK